jgi:hypothetical protein
MEKESGKLYIWGNYSMNTEDITKPIQFLKDTKVIDIKCGKLITIILTGIDNK